MDGPWADYAPTQPVSTASTDAQGPWADYAYPSSSPAEETSAPVGFNDEEKRQVLAFLPKAKKPEDLDAFARKLTNGRVGISNADEVLKDYARTKRKSYGFAENPETKTLAPEPEPTVGDYVKGAAENAGRGFVHGLGFIDDTIFQPFRDLANLPETVRGIYHGLTGGPTKEDLEEIRSRAGPGFFEKNAGDVYDSVAGIRKPKNNLQRYINAGAEGVGASLIPMGEFNGVRGVVGSVSGGATGGLAAQAASDVFPDSPLAPTLGALIGAHVGATPFALKPIRENVSVAKTVERPDASYLPDAANDLSVKAASQESGGLVPKKRGKLTVPQINDIAEKHLRGKLTDMTRLVRTGQMDPERARTLKLAIQNRDGITPTEINALRGDVEGDAVAEALHHYKAVQDLTPPAGGDGRGIMAKAWNLTVPKVLPKLVGDMLTIKPGDANAARIRAADTAIDRNPLFQRVQRKVGPSPVGPAMEKFNQKVADSYAFERDAQTQAAADAAAQANREAARSGMTDLQDAKHSAREMSAKVALMDEPVPAPRKAKVQSALNKYNKVADSGADKLAQFDEKLNAPPPEPKAPKESAMDKTVRANIEQGVHGNYNAYADTLGVNREDVLRALKSIKTDDIPPLEIDKLIHGYKLSPAGRAGLIPRLQKALTDDGTIAARAKEAEAPKPPAPTQTKSPKMSAQPKAAEPVEQAPEPAPDPNEKNFKFIRRPAAHAQGKADLDKAFDSHIGRMKTDEDLGHSRDIMHDAEADIKHIRDNELTTESAMRFFDEYVGPRLRAKGHLPEEIDGLRKDLEYASRVGKRYQTDADLEAKAMTKGPGRPRKPKPKDDGYPDPKDDPDYVPF